MKHFLFRHKTKIIVAVLIAAVLTGAFLWGGNYAKSGGNETAETVLTAGETASPRYSGRSGADRSGGVAGCGHAGRDGSSKGDAG